VLTPYSQQYSEDAFPAAVTDSDSEVSITVKDQASGCMSTTMTMQKDFFDRIGQNERRNTRRLLVDMPSDQFLLFPWQPWNCRQSMTKRTWTIKKAAFEAAPSSVANRARSAGRRLRAASRLASALRHKPENICSV
jgi:hypothetical protein